MKFVNGTPRQGLLHWTGSFCKKKAFHIHKDGPDAKNRKKNGQKTSKKGVFSSPSSQLAEFLPKRVDSFGEKSSLVSNELAHLRKTEFGPKRAGSFGYKLDFPHMSQLIWGKTQLAGWTGKNMFFWGGFPHFAH